MNLILFLGAALVALALLPALVPRFDFLRWAFGDLKPRRWSLLNFWADQTGVVVITYLYPTGNNNATPPTAVQASQCIEQTAIVFFADADTQAVVVHNWGLAASAPFFGFPMVWMIKTLGGATDSFATAFTFGLTITNSVTINKVVGAAGSGGTYLVNLRKVPFVT